MHWRSVLPAQTFPTLSTLFFGTCPASSRFWVTSASRDQTSNTKGETARAHVFPRNISSPIPCRSFLRSRSQPKPRRNLRSRYATMMESIGSRSARSVSSDSGSFTTRRARSSSIASPSSFTNPTNTHQDSDQGRLGTGFSVLKHGVSKSQTPHATFPKILALPPWLRDTITELGASHPLRAVFPTFHDASDSGVAKHPPENSSNHPTSQHARPSGANWPFRLPSTPPRIPPPRPPQPGSNTSSEEPQPFSTHYHLYHNDPLLHLRPGSPTPSIDALTQSEGVYSTAANTRPSPSAPIRVANTAHIPGSKTTPFASSSLSHNQSGPVSPAPRHNAEEDCVFRYNPSLADSAVAVPPNHPFVFERPIRVYFDSPIEDPISSDPSESGDHDPFKLDPEECKNLNFKWTPFDLRAGTGG